MQIRNVLAIMAVAAAGAPAADWIKLFDGKTLKGWSVHSGTATYAVDKGEIVGTAVLGSPNTFLCTDREFGDFILEFEVNVNPEMNSGVQFRSQIAKEAFEIKVAAKEGKKGKNGKDAVRKMPADRVYGYQAEIATKASGNCGNVYDEARRARFLDDFKDRPKAKEAFKDNQWNKYKIECRGDSIKTWINGIACANFKDAVTKRGIIGLQVHQIGKDKFKPYQVRFRNIRIKEF